jgi:hypothetical protein
MQDFRPQAKEGEPKRQKANAKPRILLNSISAANYNASPE